MTVFIHFLCLCSLDLTIKLIFNISKVTNIPSPPHGGVFANFWIQISNTRGLGINLLLYSAKYRVIAFKVYRKEIRIDLSSGQNGLNNYSNGNTRTYLNPSAKI